MVDYALADAIYKKLISIAAAPATAQIAYNSILGKTPSIPVADAAYQNVLAEETKNADRAYAAAITQGSTAAGAQVFYDFVIKKGTMYAQLTYDYIKANITTTTPPVTATPVYGQRYCVDSQTIGVWNQVDNKYDIQKCSTDICKDGNCVSSTTTPPTPVLGQKEYVFEFSGNLSGLSNTAIGAINKIVQLLGGKTAYIEGNKIVVVM
jgi:hypothetical protein